MYTYTIATTHLWVYILGIYNLCHPRTSTTACIFIICGNTNMHDNFHAYKILDISEYSLLYTVCIYTYMHLCTYHGYMTRKMGMSINKILRVVNIISKSLLYTHPSYTTIIIVHGHQIRYIQQSTHTHTHASIYIHMSNYIKLYIYSIHVYNVL